MTTTFISVGLALVLLFGSDLREGRITDSLLSEEGKDVSRAAEEGHGICITRNIASGTTLTIMYATECDAKDMEVLRKQRMIQNLQCFKANGRGKFYLTPNQVRILNKILEPITPGQERIHDWMRIGTFFGWEEELDDADIDMGGLITTYRDQHFEGFKTLCHANSSLHMQSASNWITRFSGLSFPLLELWESAVMPIKNYSDAMTDSCMLSCAASLASAGKKLSKSRSENVKHVKLTGEEAEVVFHAYLVMHLVSNRALMELHAQEKEVKHLHSSSATYEAQCTAILGLSRSLMSQFPLWKKLPSSHAPDIAQAIVQKLLSEIKDRDEKLEKDNLNALQEKNKVAKKLAEKDRIIMTKQKKLDEAGERADEILEAHKKALQTKDAVVACKEDEISRLKEAHASELEDWSAKVLRLREKMANETAAVQTAETVKEKDAEIQKCKKYLEKAKVKVLGLLADIEKMKEDGKPSDNLIAERDTLVSERDIVTSQRDALSISLTEVTRERNVLSLNLRRNEQAEADRIRSKVDREVAPLKQELTSQRSINQLLAEDVSRLENAEQSLSAELRGQCFAYTALKEDLAALKKAQGPRTDRNGKEIWMDGESLYTEQLLLRMDALENELERKKKKEMKMAGRVVSRSEDRRLIRDLVRKNDALTVDSELRISEMNSLNWELGTCTQEKESLTSKLEESKKEISRIQSEVLRIFDWRRVGEEQG